MAKRDMWVCKQYEKCDGRVTTWGGDVSPHPCPYYHTFKTKHIRMRKLSDNANWFRIDCYSAHEKRRTEKGGEQLAIRWKE